MILMSTGILPEIRLKSVFFFFLVSSTGDQYWIFSEDFSFFEPLLETDSRIVFRLCFSFSFIFGWIKGGGNQTRLYQDRSLYY